MNTRKSDPTTAKARTALALAVAVLVVGGFVLALYFGKRFIFTDTESYRAAAWWVFAVLIPVVGLAFRSEPIAKQLRLKFPTPWVRRWVIYPLYSALLAGMVVLAPLGWAATYTWAAGTSAGPMAGRLAWVEAYRPSSKGCAQRGELLVGGHSGRICLEGLGPLPMTANSPVEVAGKLSSMGLLIEGLSRP